MRYEQFKEAWAYALDASGLRVLHPQATESLDMNSMTRSFEVFVEPSGHQDARPFFVAARLSWKWDALQAARTRSTEEDLLTELLGREESDSVETQIPWLRVDIRFNASLMPGEAVPLPSVPLLANWAREVGGRLARIERLLPDKVVDDIEEGLPRVLAWQGEPSLKVRCTSEGELLLHAVHVNAWQAINLRRVWDDPEREQDADPQLELAAMFKRVRAALHAWMEAMDHLGGQRGHPGHG